MMQLLTSTPLGLQEFFKMERNPNKRTSHGWTTVITPVVFRKVFWYSMFAGTVPAL